MYWRQEDDKEQNLRALLSLLYQDVRERKRKLRRGWKALEDYTTMLKLRTDQGLRLTAKHKSFCRQKWPSFWLWWLSPPLVNVFVKMYWPALKTSALYEIKWIKPSLRQYTCNLSTEKVQARGSEVQNQFGEKSNQQAYSAVCYTYLPAKICLLIQ